MTFLIQKIGLLVLFLFVSCRTEDSSHWTPRVVKYTDMGPPPSASYAALEVAERDIPRNVSPQKRMVIKTAQITTVVSNYKQTVAELEEIITRMRGYMVSSSSGLNENNKISGSVTIRIPSARFGAAIDSIAKLATKVISKTINGNDITEEFYDVSTRLENKRKLETRYLDVLRLAKTVKDILEVEEALGNIREQIEYLEGRKNLLSDQVAYSSITGNIRESSVPLAGVAAFWSKMQRGFRNGLNGFADVLAFCITVLISGIPVIIILFIASLVALRTIKAIKQRKPSVVTNV